jgi:hypothetical protein
MLDDANPDRLRNAAATVPSLRIQFAMKCIGAAAPEIDAQDLCRAAGIEPSLLDRPDARVSFASLQALFEEAALRTKDASFGLRAGRMWQPAMYDVLGYAILNSKTLEQAFERLRPYFHALHGPEETALIVEGPSARFTYRITNRGNPASRYQTEAFMMIVSRVAGCALGKQQKASFTGF